MDAVQFCWNIILESNKNALKREPENGMGGVALQWEIKKEDQQYAQRCKKFGNITE